jgi:hypothetical protein
MLHRVVVLNHGIKIAEGPPSEVAALSDVVLGYLGQAKTVYDENPYQAMSRIAIWAGPVYRGLLRTNTFCMPPLRLRRVFLPYADVV